MPFNKKKVEIKWLIYFIFFSAIISFVVIPFSGDIEVFLGSSRLADYFGKDPVYNSFNVWEIKGTLLRLFFYLFYLVAGLFADIPSTSFSIIISTMYALLVMIVLWAIVHMSVKNKTDRTLCLSLLCISFFAVDTWSKLQAEMTCSMLLLLAIAFALKDGKHREGQLLFSGILIGLMFWFKLPLLLLSVVFVAEYFLLKKENEVKLSIKHISIVVIGAFVSLFAIGLLVYFINPGEYSRMIMTSIYQNTLFSGNNISLLHVLKSFISGYIKSMMSIPVIFVGSSCLIVNIIYAFKKKKIDDAFWHIIAWVIPAIYVMISNCYFTYHYLTFLVPAIVEVWLSINRDLNCFHHKLDSPVIFGIGGVLLLFTLLSNFAKPIVYTKYNVIILELIGCAILASLFFVSVFEKRRTLIIYAVCGYALLIFFTYSVLFSANSFAYISLKNSSYRNDFSLPISQNEKILYLDAGDGAYYLGYKTYYEEYYPLILQRIDEGSERSLSPRYVDASNTILSFDGEFVCLTEDFIFPNGKNKTLKQKILNEYKIYRSLNVYFTPTSIFSMQSQENMHQLNIYRRSDE